MSCRHSEQSAKQWKYQPSKNALYYPIAFPAPILNLIDRNIAAGLAESPSSYDKKS